MFPRLLLFGKCLTHFLIPFCFLWVLIQHALVTYCENLTILSFKSLGWLVLYRFYDFMWGISFVEQIFHFQNEIYSNLLLVQYISVILFFIPHNQVQRGMLIQCWLGKFPIFLVYFCLQLYKICARLAKMCQQQILQWIWLWQSDDVRLNRGDFGQLIILAL
jgi:hypothetical protein